MSVKGGNMYEWWGVHVIDRVSTATASGSGLQLLYTSSCVFVLEVNKSVEKRLNLFSSSRNTFLFNLQLLESFKWRESQSALMFSTPGRCSAWIVILLCIPTPMFLLLILKVVESGCLPYDSERQSL